MPRKNILVLIDAVERLVGEGHDLSLVIAGTGPEKAAIEARVRRASTAIRFVGFIDEAEKRRLLTQADVFVQLSTREGLSIAAIEALASGVPCVVSDLPGVREPIDAETTGWYVADPESVESVVAALRRVLADRDQLYRVLMNLGREHERVGRASDAQREQLMHGFGDGLVGEFGRVVVFASIHQRLDRV